MRTPSHKSTGEISLLAALLLQLEELPRGLADGIPFGCEREREERAERGGERGGGIATLTEGGLKVDLLTTATTTTTTTAAPPPPSSSFQPPTPDATTFEQDPGFTPAANENWRNCGDRAEVTLMILAGRARARQTPDFCQDQIGIATLSIRPFTPSGQRRRRSFVLLWSPPPPPVVDYLLLLFSPRVLKVQHCCT